MPTARDTQPIVCGFLPPGAELPGSARSVVQIRRAFVFLDGVAAVDNDELAGDIGGRFRCEKRDGGGDFVRTARATHRSVSACDDFVICGRSGFNPAGSDRIDRDLPARDFESEATSKSDYGGFSSAVRSFARITHDRTGGRGNVDNARSSLSACWAGPPE